MPQNSNLNKNQEMNMEEVTKGVHLKNKEKYANITLNGTFHLTIAKNEGEQ